LIIKLKITAATQIVDLYHAREHLHELAKLLEFMLGGHKQNWLEERLTELDNGNIDAITAAARAFPLSGRKAGDLETALGYFQHNACRMHYARFKSLGMFVGSGVLDAFHPEHRWASCVIEGVSLQVCKE